MRPWHLRATFLLLALTLSACGGEPDPRLATPQATVETLLQATHLWGVGPLSPGGFGERGLPGPPIDVATVALCFWDYDRDDPSSRAMGEFVAGMLAAGQRGILYRLGQRRAVARSGRRDVHFIHAREGWLIVLADTVPPEIRQGLRTGGRRLRPPDEIL